MHGVKLAPGRGTAQVGNDSFCLLNPPYGPSVGHKVTKADKGSSALQSKKCGRPPAHDIALYFEDTP
jgi:hypothetical protein